MNKVDTIQLLELLENQVEKHLKETIFTFQNLDEDTLVQIPDNRGWSIAQCFEHLNSYGRYYFSEIEKAMNHNRGKAASDTFKSTWLGDYFRRMMLPSNTKKYKAFKNHVPAVNLDAHAVIAEFIEQQETFLRYLKDAREVNLNTIRIPVSIARLIKLKLGDVFQFIIAHDERHIQQAQRTLAGVRRQISRDVKTTD